MKVGQCDRGDCSRARLISPSLASSLRCLDVVVAFTAEAALTQQPPGLLSSLGGAAIVAGVGALAAQHTILAWCSHRQWWPVKGGVEERKCGEGEEEVSLL